MAAVTPKLLSNDDFKLYSLNWTNLLNNNVPKGSNGNPIYTMSSVFATAVPTTASNYVYLPNEAAIALMSAVGTNTIQTQFVVVAPPAAASYTFSIVLFGIDAFGNRTSAYYLAGVPDSPAQIINGGDSQPDAINTVGFDLIQSWITHWQKVLPTDVSPAMFTPGSGITITGYAYPLNDFLDALKPITAITHQHALWLSFALHQYDAPGATNAAPPSEMFSTVLSLNTIPQDMMMKSSGEPFSGTFALSPDDLYYDISKPCPPYGSAGYQQQ